VAQLLPPPLDHRPYFATTGRRLLCEQRLVVVVVVEIAGFLSTGNKQTKEREK
jgi:hypothetical protein